MKEWEIKHTVECKLLDGEIIEYNIWGTEYKEHIGMVYLGLGKVYSFDGNTGVYPPLIADELRHFWRKKTVKEFKQELFHREALNQIKQTNHIVYTTTDDQTFQSKEKAIQHQEELNKKYVWCALEMASYGLYYDKKIIKVFQTEQQAKEHLYKSPNNNLYIIKKELE